MMKECSYCGRDNTDEAVNCRECGTEFELPKIDAGGGLHDAVKTETLRLFANHESAAIAAANLEAHGIKCWLSSDDCGGMYPSMTAATGVRLRVRDEDAPAATALLDTPLPASEMASQNETTSASEASTKPTRRKLTLGQLFIGIIIGVVLSWFYHGIKEDGQHTYYHYAKNGKADEAWKYKDGYLFQSQRDRNHDGEWDDWCFYDSRGNIIKAEGDDNFDGKPDVFWIYSNGELVSSQEDTDYNGTPDAFVTYSNHIIQQLDMRPNGAQHTTVREIFKNGVVTEIWRGGDSSGHFQEVVQYDPFFNPISTNGFIFQKIAQP